MASWGVSCPASTSDWTKVSSFVIWVRTPSRKLEAIAYIGQLTGSWPEGVGRKALPDLSPAHPSCGAQMSFLSRNDTFALARGTSDEDAPNVNRGFILFLLALALIGAAIAATALPGPALCLPPECDPPISISWPFGPAGLSGLRILTVFVFFLLTAILV